MRHWLLALSLLLALPACGDKSDPTEDDDDDEQFDPLSTTTSCMNLCDALCEHASELTGEELSDADCRATCTDAPSSDNECRDCWVWMQEAIWDEHRVMADCYCVSKPEAQNPYAEDCETIVDEYYEGDSSTLEEDCAEGCLDP